MNQDTHVTDEDLLLDYYGEGSPDARAAMRAHLAVCDRCGTLDRELRGVLALVNTEPVPEAPEGFEREMWARLEPHVASGFSRTGPVRLKPDPTSAVRLKPDTTSVVRLKPDTTSVVRLKPDTTFAVRLKPDPTFWRFELPRWAFAVGTAALAIGAFSLGRVWDPAPVPSTDTVADATDIGERLLRSEVEEYLERSQRVLVELVNTDDDAPVMLASDRERAADLVADGRLYRRSIGETGDADTRDLLEDVERVLVEIANGPEAETSNHLSGVRARISNQDLIFRLRLMTAEMRERERRARPTW